MKVLIAIDSFKGSLSSKELSNGISDGINIVFPDAEIIKVPIADGGEGTITALVEGLDGKMIEAKVQGPLSNKISAKYGILKDGTAIIELAEASGLTLIDEKHRNPMNTTTYGVGELIKDAINKGCREFIIGIGGSATNDGGIGMLEALGYRFYDKKGNVLKGIGKSLSKISKIDISNKLQVLNQCKFLIACDVENPLFGINGAAYCYAHQKGANEVEIELLDKGLRNFSEVIQKELGKNISSLEGAGAAGGIGGGFNAFLNGTLEPGTNLIFEKINLKNKLKGVDIVITGEGKVDCQSLMGKAPLGVAKLAKNYGIPVVILAGSLSDDAKEMHNYGVTSLFSIFNSPMTLEEAMNKKNAYKLVVSNTEEIFRLIKYTSCMNQ